MALETVHVEKQESPYIGSLIGRGRLAEVYALSDNQAIKLFHEGRSSDLIEQEARISRLVHEAGLLTPSVGDIVKVNGRMGIVYERLTGTSMLTQLSTKPWKIIRSALNLAGLHVSMHRQIISNLPKQRQELKESIVSVRILSKSKVNSVLKLLDELPDGEVLCHGDFHPDNVIMTSDDAVIIDWTTATKGNPIADVARTSLLLQMAYISSDAPISTRWAVQAGRGLFHRLYLRHYFRLKPGHQQELVAWQLPIAVARMSEGIEEEQTKLLSIVERWFSSRTS